MRRHRNLAFLFALLVVGTCASGKDADLQMQIQALRDGQNAIQSELNLIKDLLLGKQPPLDNVPVHVAGAPYAGGGKAGAAIVEFADFQCPFCAVHFKEVYPLLYSDYIRTGKVRYFFLDFPLDSIHPAAQKAAEAVRCAAVQGKFPEMHDRLFGNQNSLTVEDLAGNAEAVGLDVARFKACLSPGIYAADVRKDIAEGLRLGVEATPTFFLGTFDPVAGLVRATVMLKGVQPYAAFREALDRVTGGT